MKIRIRLKKAAAVLLAVILACSSVPIALGAGGTTIQTLDSNAYPLLEGTDFEDSDAWGFSPGGGAAAAVVEDSGNHYLKTSGSGSGTRSIVKTLAEPTDRAAVLFTFDWKPGEVSTAANSSEVLFSDTFGTPLLRLVKAGGPNGEIKYGIGETGPDLTRTVSVTDVTYNNDWLSVRVLFDFANESALIQIQDRDDAANHFTSPTIDLSSLNYVNRIAKISVVGNRASGNTLGFETSLDNMYIYASDESAPIQAQQNIVSITTVYETQITLAKGIAKDDVIHQFPNHVAVKLENEAVVQGVPVYWDSADYDSDQLGSYTFTGQLDVADIPNVVNGHAVTAIVTVIVAEADESPPIEGYENRYYSNFGDTVAPVPVNWGFTTANAALSLNTGNVGGNSTSKLQYSIVDQSGGRVASKNFDTAVKGNQILVTFDWYPGKVNDKGGNANENGGEFRILDSSNNIVFTINNTNNAPLAYWAGGHSESAAATGMLNPEAWYKVEISFDLISNDVNLKLTDQTAGRSENYSISLDGIAFDGSVAGVRLVGVRTSGNNLTWTTYLDNFGVYHVPIPENTISRVDTLPYHRVYVNETTNDIASIGLPNIVTATLADNSKAEVAVSEWMAIDIWAAGEAGVYEFQGILAETDGLVNSFDRTATIYVYNRLAPPDTARQTEWLDRGVIALQSETDIFISWRLLADEYDQDVKFNIYRNGQRLNTTPLWVTNYADMEGRPGDNYKIETLRQGIAAENDEAIAAGADYLSIPMQKPEGGTTASGAYTYSVNDASVGDLDGDGQYEIIVKWYPSNAIDSSQEAMTGPTIFDAYRLDGTLLWRMNMGLNLTSGAHYHQFIVADFDGDGKSEFLIKTADATTVYGTTDGEYDNSKVISVIGNPDDDGKWVNDRGHIFGGPEYISVFKGDTGEVIDTVDYVFALGDVASWGDTWHNRSDRFLAGLAYLDGVKPSAVYGRGYYERTTYAAYSLVDGKLEQQWTFDSAVEGKGGGMGYHSLATGDVDNDGFDEIIAGSLVLDQDGTILYIMDGEMGRERGSHGDALHVGAFDPAREGLHFIGVHEDPAVASLEYHDGATGETIMSFNAYVDAGRGLAANITSHPGYEFWGTAGPDAATGGGIYNVQGSVIANSFRNAGLPVNFALYWDGDLLHELLDRTSITKYNEAAGTAEVMRSFDGVVSNNGTKATPTLQADILGDWREEVLLPTTDSSELRIFSTTIPTEYRLYTLMHDTVYRMGIAWQNTAYNQPPHIGFYLGEDIRETVLAGKLQAPAVAYTNKPAAPEPNPDDDKPVNPSYPSAPIFAGTPEQVVIGEDGSAALKATGKFNAATKRYEAVLKKDIFETALRQAKPDSNGNKHVIVELAEEGQSYAIQLPAEAVRSSSGKHQLTIASPIGNFVLPHHMLEQEGLNEDDVIEFVFAVVEAETDADKKVIQVSIQVNGVKLNWESKDAFVRISLPYKPSELEAERHEHIVVIYIDEQGHRSPVTNGHYKPAKGTVDFTTNHFSQFAISFVHKTFSDLERYEWARKAIEVLASKGVIAGTSEVKQTFAPEANLSRADFAMLLVNVLELQAEIDENFDDVRPSDYYYEAVGIAKSLGIVHGSGNNEFKPKAAITRQDMMVMTARAMRIAEADELGAASLLEHYTDHQQIAEYARQSIAAMVDRQLIIGAYGKMNPLGLTTRAEAAVFLYRIYTKIHIQNVVPLI